jgi:Ras GTPase-activating protein-binding protein 1
MATVADSYMRDSRRHSENLVQTDAMDQSPSPELNPVKIAQDFILQYYAVRSRYPDSLYRFYREDSILTMGCHQDEHVVVGKNAIATHFANIGYRNCINSVAAFNAQFVMPDCISILISGEMSNNDEMLRRYSEMFTLIRYGVDRFYVKSHMFHFQDDAFNDNSACSGSVCDQPSATAAETCEPVEPSKTENGYIVHETPSQNYMNEPMHVTSHQLETNVIESNVQMNHPQESLVNEPHETDNEINTYSSEVQNHVGNFGGHSYEGVEALSQQWHEIGSNGQESVADELETHQTESNDPPVPKTWAGIAGSGPKLGSQVVQPVQPRRPAPQPIYENERKSKTLVLEQPPGEPIVDPAHIQDDSVRVGQGRQRGPPSAGNGPFRSKQYNSFSGPRKGAAGFTDKQLFVGNLPHDCEENELREFFEQFGSVLQVRINPSKDNLPYYGFVEMDCQESVEKILQIKPLMFRGTRRINAEKRNAENGTGRQSLYGREYRKNQFGGEKMQR